MPTYATQINDPWTSVDMVLPVDRGNYMILTFHVPSLAMTRTFVISIVSSPAIFRNYQKIEKSWQNKTDKPSFLID